MILDQETLKKIAAAATDVQRAVYYERERLQPKDGDIGAYLARREYHLMVAVIRELWALGWRPTVASDKADEARNVRKPTKRR